MLIVLDTNCWIDASKDSSSPAFAVIALAQGLGHRVAVSKHSLSELSNGTALYGPEAEALARGCEELPYYPIGQISELLGTIAELAGTIGDMRGNEQLRERLGGLAKSGADLRDRGALIDALWSHAQYFVTSDNHIVADAPRLRIETAIFILVRSPVELVRELQEQPRVQTIAR